MPFTLYPDQPIATKADWGPRVKVGVPGHEGDFFLLQADDDIADFWTLPVDLKTRYDALNAATQRARDSIAETPNVRYSNVSAAKARRIQKDAADERKLPAPVDDVAQQAEHANAEEEGRRREYGANVSECMYMY